MSLKQTQQVPVKMVPVFTPVYDQLEKIVATMNKERRVMETADSPAEAPINAVSLINSTLASAVNSWHQSRKVVEDKKKGSLVQLVGGEVLGKMKADERKGVVKK